MPLMGEEEDVDEKYERRERTLSTRVGMIDVEVFLLFSFISLSLHFFSFPFLSFLSFINTPSPFHNKGV